MWLCVLSVITEQNEVINQDIVQMETSGSRVMFNKAKKRKLLVSGCQLTFSLGFGLLKTTGPLS